MKLREFHIAFYTDDKNSLLSGVTYLCKSIRSALVMFEKDPKVKVSIDRIKYITDRTNLSQDEMNYIRIPNF